jgi:hypothetical protein
VTPSENRSSRHQTALAGKPTIYSMLLLTTYHLSSMKALCTPVLCTKDVETKDEAQGKTKIEALNFKEKKFLKYATKLKTVGWNLWVIIKE